MSGFGLVWFFNSMGKHSFFWVKQENTPTKDTWIPPFQTDHIRQPSPKVAFSPTEADLTGSGHT